MGPTDIDTGDYYYNDPETLTFDLAEILVERYLNEKGGMKHVLRANHILTSFEYPETPHNHFRISRALEDRCEPYSGSGDFGPKRYVVPERYKR